MCLTAAACFRLPQQGAQTSGNCFRWEIKEMLSAERQIDQLHHPAVPEPEAFICFLSFFFFFWRRTECRCVWKCLYLCTWLNICVIHQVRVLVWCDKTSFYFLQIAVAEEEKEVVVWKQINNISECSTSAVSRLFLTLTLQSLLFFSFFFFSHSPTFSLLVSDTPPLVSSLPSLRSPLISPKAQTGLVNRETEPYWSAQKGKETGCQ